MSEHKTRLDTAGHGWTRLAAIVRDEDGLLGVRGLDPQKHEWRLGLATPVGTLAIIDRASADKLAAELTDFSRAIA